MALFLAYVVVASICACQTIEGVPPQEKTPDAVKQAGMRYMDAFYIGRSCDEKVPLEPTAENLETAMRDVQRHCGLDQTGEIDEPTARAMSWPRCGCHDIIDVKATCENEKRYETAGPYFKWPNTDLTYRLSNYPSISKITPDEVDEAVATALKFWSDVSPLTFRRVYGSASADIEMTFARRDHSYLNARDQYPFDGPGRVLAHAFFPTRTPGLDGDVHYDDDENFTHNEYDGINLLFVVVHEVGHAIGLGHSEVEDAIMFPYIHDYSPNLQLHEDDILGIQSVYGPNPNPPEREPTTTLAPTTLAPITPATVPEYCELDFDDVAFIRGDILAFLGNKFWRFSSSGHLLDDGSSIKSFFPSYSLYGVNGIFERWIDGVIRIVRGPKVYDISRQKFDKVVVRRTSDFGIPRVVNCTMHSASKQVTYYFFKGLVYKYNEAGKSMTKDSPLKIHKVFQGIRRGTRVSAAFTGKDGHYYLLVGREYYKVDPDLKRVGDLSNFGQDFLGCPRNV